MKLRPEKDIIADGVVSDVVPKLKYCRAGTGGGGASAQYPVQTDNVAESLTRFTRQFV